jgi:uncharacterized damage-inducible protein DinB
MKTRVTLIAACLILPEIAVAQEFQRDDANPASGSLRQFYEAAKRNIVRGAEKMPESHYAFRPTPEVRTFGQLVAHIADVQFLFCSSLRDEANPNGTNLRPGDASDTIEKGKTAKQDLVAALNAAFAYCDPPIGSLTDAHWKNPVKVLGEGQRKATPLMLTIVHLWEHYGNMVTYLRIKGIVPPSSEPRSAADQAAPPTGTDKDAPVGRSAAKAAQNPVEALAWLLGRWTADSKLADGTSATIEADFQWTNHKRAIKYSLVKRAGGRLLPAGEGICGWHPPKRTLVLWEVDQDGNVTESTLLAEASKVVYDEVIYGADGSALPVRAEALRQGDDRFVFRASVEKDGSWPVVFEAVYSRAVAK